MLSPRSSIEEEERREIPSFIEARPPLVLNPFMRPKPTKGKRLFTDPMEDSECEEPEAPELVKVYLRLKPCNVPSNLYEVHSERSLITSLDITTAGHGRRTQHNVPKMYTFSHIFGPNSSQKELFEHVVKENIKKLPEGNSFTLLTYGTSGSGKTFTLMGTVSAPGLVPRSLEYVFKVVEAEQSPVYKPDERGPNKLSKAEQDFELKLVRQLRQISGSMRDKYCRMSAALGDLTGSNIDLANRKSHYVWVSFVEIYNEAIYDLLAPGDRRNASKLAIREDAGGNVYVKGAVQAFVRSGAEAYDVLVAGKVNLQVAATGIHAQSSRSHCIFTITMLSETEYGMRSACVRLCDLAGCERAARTGNTGARMTESRAINASLHVLERCLRDLRRKRTADVLVPYRESKLTRLLGAGLSGTRGEAVSMVVTLNPSPKYANETKHVLKLAAVAKDIQISDTLTEYPSSMESSSQDTTIAYTTSFEIMKLRADNERLMFELKQAQARNREYRACMEEKQAAHEKMLWEVLEETKATYKELYEAEIKALQDKMVAMEEEYESRLGELGQGIPSTKYQDRIDELMTKNAILEDKITALELGRERDAAEMDYLRTCIEQRDAEHADESAEENDDVISLDSESSDNESLTPVLKKKHISRIKQIRQSMIEEINMFKRASRMNEFNSEVSDEEKTSDTMNDHDKDTYLSTRENLNSTDTTNNSDQSDIETDVISTVKKASRCTYVVDKNDDDDVATVNYQEEKICEPKRQLSRETYCVATSEVLEDKVQDEIPNSVKHTVDLPLNTVETKTEIRFTPSIKQSIESNTSLLQFERLEMEMRDVGGKERVTGQFYNIKHDKKNRKYFDDGLDTLIEHPKTPATVVKAKNKKFFFDNSHVGKTKIEDNLSENSKTNVVPLDLELLGESMTRQANKTGAVKKFVLSSKHHASMDIFEDFESPRVNKDDIVKTQPKAIENIRQSVEKIVIADKICSNIDTVNLIPSIKSESNDMYDTVQKVTSKIEETGANVKDSNLEIISTDNIVKQTSKMDESTIHPHDNNNESQLQANCTKTNDTTVEFENIYKDISAPRTTEFELLVSQESTEENQNKTEFEFEDSQYNLRRKTNLGKAKTERKRGINKVIEGELLLESTSKCESKSKPRRNLRLRRPKGTEEDNEKGKLEDIGNLQVQFSDVTMGLPAPLIASKDILSPEKHENQENSSPILGIQSCPAKSITRSRRKLFTPRAEPLDESLGAAAGSDDKVRVPRPSYHRPRARRKL